MTITARYASTCPACSQPITPGQSVEWTRGSKATHVTCGAASPSSSSRPSSGRCVYCHHSLSAWERTHGIRRCAECRDGGTKARGGQSYYDQHGRFVLGSDD